MVDSALTSKHPAGLKYQRADAAEESVSVAGLSSQAFLNPEAQRLSAVVISKPSTLTLGCSWQWQLLRLSGFRSLSHPFNHTKLQPSAVLWGVLYPPRWPSSHISPEELADNTVGPIHVGCASQCAEGHQGPQVVGAPLRVPRTRRDFT